MNEANKDLFIKKMNAELIEVDQTFVSEISSENTTLDEDFSDAYSEFKDILQFDPGEARDWQVASEAVSVCLRNRPAAEPGAGQKSAKSASLLSTPSAQSPHISPRSPHLSPRSPRMGWAAAAPASPGGGAEKRQARERQGHRRTTSRSIGERIRHFRRDSLNFFTSEWEFGLYLHLHENFFTILYNTIREPRKYDLNQVCSIDRIPNPRQNQVDLIRLEFEKFYLDLGCSTTPKVNLIMESLLCNWRLLHRKKRPLPPVPAYDEFETPYSPFTCYDACETGDIVIYKTKAITGNITRAITQKEWDHIGMFVWVYIEGKRTLGILEALADKGTQLWPWNCYIEKGWHKEYSAVCVRHLRIPNPELKMRVQHQIRYFVQKAIDKPYSLFREFLQRDSRELENPKRTFFCSSLIAKAYKTVGLLQTNISSNSYYPGHFGPGSGLTLLQGCYLSKPNRIDFSLENPDVQLVDDPEIEGSCCPSDGTVDERRTDVENTTLECPRETLTCRCAIM